MNGVKRLVERKLALERELAQINVELEEIFKLTSSSSSSRSSQNPIDVANRSATSESNGFLTRLFTNTDGEKETHSPFQQTPRESNPSVTPDGAQSVRTMVDSERKTVTIASVSPTSFVAVASPSEFLENAPSTTARRSAPSTLNSNSLALPQSNTTENIPIASSTTDNVEENGLEPKTDCKSEAQLSLFDGLEVGERDASQASGNQHENFTGTSDKTEAPARPAAQVRDDKDNNPTDHEDEVADEALESKAKKETMTDATVASSPNNGRETLKTLSDSTSGRGNENEDRKQKIERSPAPKKGLISMPIAERDEFEFTASESKLAKSVSRSEKGKSPQVSSSSSTSDSSSSDNDDDVEIHKVKKPKIQLPRTSLAKSSASKNRDKPRRKFGINDVLHDSTSSSSSSCSSSESDSEISRVARKKVSEDTASKKPQESRHSSSINEKPKEHLQSGIRDVVDLLDDDD